MAILGSRKLVPMSSPSNQLPPNQPAPYTPSTTQTNTMAIVSLITGVLSVFGHLAIPGLGGGILAVIAIITGVIARGEIKRTGEQGMWMSTVGIVLGVLHLAVIALLFILLILAVSVLGGWVLLHR
jgi:hypothetical protein